MKYTEHLDWILDKKTKIFNDEEMDLNEKIRLNIEFVHSLGLKATVSVGVNLIYPIQKQMIF